MALEQDVLQAQSQVLARHLHLFPYTPHICQFQHAGYHSPKHTEAHRPRYKTSRGGKPASGAQSHGWRFPACRSPGSLLETGFAVKPGEGRGVRGPLQATALKSNEACRQHFGSSGRSLPGPPTGFPRRSGSAGSRFQSLATLGKTFQGGGLQAGTITFSHARELPGSSRCVHHWTSTFFGMQTPKRLDVHKVFQCTVPWDVWILTGGSLLEN